jgi:hypothetical protein
MGIAIRFLPFGSLLVELIASVKRRMDVLKFVLWPMTPCGFLVIKAAEESDISIFRVEGTLKMEVALYSQASIFIKIRVVTAPQNCKFIAVKFIKKFSRSGLDQD